MTPVESVEIGLYGKLPSHGDFLRRRVSDRFVAVWDAWLQQALAASRAVLGARWLDVYLTSPAWRFVCARGACGDAAVLGLMVPSVDRVGRYFPLTLVAELPADASIVGTAATAGPFFDNVERLVVDTLVQPTVDFARFDTRVRQLGGDLAALLAPASVRIDPSAAALLTAGSPGWHLPIGDVAQLTPVFHQLLSHSLTACYDPLVIWWSAGSALVEPSCLICRGLPSPDAFVALLDGAWERGPDWRTVAAAVAPDGGSGGDTLIEDLAPPQYRSAGATDKGRVRAVNQDAFLERPDAGVWVVADGLGGHRDGEVASRMVCDALADIVPHPSFEGTVQEAMDRLQQVNAHLVRAGARATPATVSGSTVAALLVRGTRCAVLWAGDSRVYRLRAGRLEQLTRDHSAEEAGGLAVESTTAITRAVGAEPSLEIDVQRDRVRPGDRFLLCSDGLPRMVPDTRIEEWLQHEYISAAVHGLINAALDGGGSDNVTVVVVEAYARGWT